MTLNNGTGNLSEQNYANIASLTAICLDRQGHTSQAMRAYGVGRNMFDGTGFKDSPWSSWPMATSS